MYCMLLHHALANQFDVASGNVPIGAHMQAVYGAPCSGAVMCGVSLELIISHSHRCRMPFPSQ